MKVKNSLTVFTILVGAMATSSHAQQQALDIQMKLSKLTVLLGEPVWVDVTVTNRSSDFLFVEMGTACPGDQSLMIKIPEAGPGRPQMEVRCYWGSGGSCPSSGPSLLAPGGSLHKRHVLAGNFRIKHPGRYAIQLKSEIGYAIEPDGERPTELIRDMASQTATEEVSLDVQEADPVQLLHLGQELAEDYAKPVPKEPEPTMSPASLKDDPAARRARDLQGTKELEAFDDRNMLAAGLAEYPVAGMEPVFHDWLMDMKGSEFYGFRALYTLNTSEARAMLAEAADESSEVYARWGKDVHWFGPGPEKAEKLKQAAFARWRVSAIHALARMGDPSYAPIIEKLTNDTNSSVRQEAILDLGLLGGEQELPKLAEIVRSDPDTDDRLNAITAMGDTQSLKAVPLLIQVFPLPDAQVPSFTNLALMTLTHHVVRYDEQRTTAQYQSLWQVWWNENQATARAYGPFQCTPS